MDMNSPNKPNILVVCGKNKKRSRTAEYIFKNDVRFNIRSVGVSLKSERKISENDLNWANLVLVMEPDQKSKILELYNYVDISSIEVLNIADDYDFLDEELIELLLDSINNSVNQFFFL